MNSKEILIIDDDETFCLILLKRLKNIGLAAKYTVNSANYLDLIKSMQPKLILLDILMPDKDGFEIVNELRSHQNKPYIVAISSNSLYLSSITRLGADKAYSKENLELVIQEVSKFFPAPTT